MLAVLQALAGQDIPSIMGHIVTVGTTLQQHDQNIIGLQNQLAVHQQQVSTLQNDMNVLQNAGPAPVSDVQRIQQTHPRIQVLESGITIACCNQG